jgi:hypothetical protein
MTQIKTSDIDGVNWRGIQRILFVFRTFERWESLRNETKRVEKLVESLTIQKVCLLMTLMAQ